MTRADLGNSGFLFCTEEQTLYKRLRENRDKQFTDLQLWLSSTTDLKDLSSAVLQNNTIQEVCLLIHESFAQHCTKDVLRLFRALGALPCLEKLLFNTYRFPFIATLPIQAFTNVLQGTASKKQLVSFKLWRCDMRSLSELDGSFSPTREMERWGNALLENKTLREFRMVKCRLTEETRMACTLDPVLQALASLPNLQEIELSATESSALGSLSKATLRAIFRSPSLLEFGMRNFDVDEEGLLEIAQALLQYHNLMQGPRKTLNNKQKNDGAQNSCCSAGRHPDQQQGSKLQSLKITGVTEKAGGVLLAKVIREAFRDVLQSNYNLENIVLFDPRNLQSEIEFYTKLNRLGRNRLLQNHCATQQDWVDILVQVKDDLGCLFYFLSMNPLLCGGNCHEEETSEDRSPRA